MAAQPLLHCDADPILLELTLERERTLLALDATEDRAFVVGASPHADVRVKREGAPPVAFYVERRGNAAWLVPGYRRRDLRVAGAIVIAPRKLGRHERIEFAGLAAELELVTPPASSELPDDDPPTELSESTRRSRLAYLDSLPDFADCTVVDRESRRSSSFPAPDVVRCPPSLVVVPRIPRAPVAPRRVLAAPGRALAAPPLAAPRVPGEPRLWSILAQRPFETVGLVLLVAAVMAAAAIAAAWILSFGTPA